MLLLTIYSIYLFILFYLTNCLVVETEINRVIKTLYTVKLTHKIKYLHFMVYLHMRYKSEVTCVKLVLFEYVMSFETVDQSAHRNIKIWFGSKPKNPNVH